MKNFVKALLCTMLIIAAVCVQAQITFTVPRPIKKTYVVSQSHGKLNYTINNGVRRNYRMTEVDTMVINLSPLKVYRFNEEWQGCRPKGSIKYVPSKGNSNDFAELMIKFNKEHRKLRWIIGVGDEIIYEYEGNISVATKNGMLTYIIRDGKRIEFERHPVMIYHQTVEERSVWLWNLNGSKTIPEPGYGVLLKTKEKESKRVEAPSPSVRKKAKLNNQDFARLQRQLLKSGWTLMALASNVSEIVYYYEK